MLRKAKMRYGGAAGPLTSYAGIASAPAPSRSKEAGYSDSCSWSWAAFNNLSLIADRTHLFLSKTGQEWSRWSTH